LSSKASSLHRHPENGKGKFFSEKNGKNIRFPGVSPGGYPGHRSGSEIVWPYRQWCFYANLLHRSYRLIGGTHMMLAIALPRLRVEK